MHQCSARWNDDLRTTLASLRKLAIVDDPLQPSAELPEVSLLFVPSSVSHTHAHPYGSSHSLKVHSAYAACRPGPICDLRQAVAPWPDASIGSSAQDSKAWCTSRECRRAMLHGQPVRPTCCFRDLRGSRLPLVGVHSVPSWDRAVPLGQAACTAPPSLAVAADM